MKVRVHQQILPVGSMTCCHTGQWPWQLISSQCVSLWIVCQPIWYACRDETINLIAWVNKYHHVKSIPLQCGIFSLLNTIHSLIYHKCYEGNAFGFFFIKCPSNIGVFKISTTKASRQPPITLWDYIYCAEYIMLSAKSGQQLRPRAIYFVRFWVVQDATDITCLK